MAKRRRTPSSRRLPKSEFEIRQERDMWIGICLEVLEENTRTAETIEASERVPWSAMERELARVIDKGLLIGSSTISRLASGLTCVPSTRTIEALTVYVGLNPYGLFYENRQNVAASSRAA